MIKVIKNLAPKYGILLITALLFAFFSFSGSYFCTIQNISIFIVGQVIVGFFALALLVPLVAGEFDISVGYMMGFCVMIGGKIGSMGVPVGITIVVTIGAGAVMGVANGLLSVTFKIPSTISTLGSGFVMYGLALACSDSKSISGCIPNQIINIACMKFLGFNVSIWLLIIVALLLYYVLEHTPFGKQIYAVGLSKRVAYLAGIRINLVRFMSFVIAGSIIGIGAFVALAQSGNAYPDTGPSYLMPGLAIVFLSITTHKVGRYNVPGIMASLLLMGIVFNGISIMGAPFWLQGVANSIILLAVVMLNNSDSRQAQVG